MRGGRVVLEITARDLDLLTLVGLAGYVSTEQLAREFFPSEDRCRRRVRQLYSARYLTVTLWGSTKPNLISLTRPGLEFVLERRPELDGRVRLAGAIRLAGVDHHLAIGDARLYAAALGELFNTPLLAWSSGSGTLARELGLGSWHLVPDGVAEFSVDGRSFTVAVEVDNCGNEPHSVLRSKFDRYVGAARAGALGALWVVVRGGEERRSGLERLVEQAGLATFAFVIDHALTIQRPVTALAGGGGASRVWAEGPPNTLLATEPESESAHGVATPTPTVVGRPHGWADGRGR